MKVEFTRFIKHGRKTFADQRKVIEVLVSDNEKRGEAIDRAKKEKWPDKWVREKWVLTKISED